MDASPITPQAPPTTPPPPRTCISCAKQPASPVDPLCLACRGALQKLQADPDVPDEPFIVTGRACADCGYDLTTLRSDRECPECGTPVLRSLRGNLLRFSDPAYVRRLHRAVFLAEVAAVLLGIGGALSGAVSVAAEANALGRATAGALVGVQVVGVAVAAFSLSAWWRLTELDPHPLGKDMAIGPRKLVRVALVLELAAYLIGLGVFLALVDFSSGGLAPAAEEVLNFMAMISGGLWLFRFFAAMLYLRTLASRLPDARLYTNCRALMWVGPLVTLLSCGIGIIIVFIAYVLMLDRFRRRLREAVVLARRFAATPAA